MDAINYIQALARQSQKHCTLLAPRVILEASKQSGKVETYLAWILRN